MMLPSQQIMATTPNGGSHHQANTRLQLGQSTEGARVLPAHTQFASGNREALEVAQQGMDTAMHRVATEALAAQGGGTETDARNLLTQYKAAILQSGAVTPRGPDGGFALAQLIG